MNKVISKIIETRSWKVGVLILVLGIPFGLLYIIRLQNSGAADDLGLWYRVYCAIAYTSPVAVAGFVIHVLVRKFMGKQMNALKREEIGICTCPCHDKPHAVIHPVECCEKCPKCKRDISRGMMEAHLQACVGQSSK